MGSSACSCIEMRWNMMDFSEIDNTLHCFFSGHLDGNICSAIEKGLLQRINDFRKNRETIRITFDLAKVVYISSAFLRICLMCCKVVGQHCFAVINVSENIYSVFHISSLDDIISVTCANETPKIT